MGLAIGIAELISAVGVWLGALSTASSPINSLGTTFIHLTPEWLKEYAIRTFGQHDKDALRVGMYITLFIVALVIGLVARRSPRIAAGITVLLILITIGAIYTTTGAIAFDAVPILVGGAAGVYLLVTVFRRTVEPQLLSTGVTGQQGHPPDDRPATRRTAVDSGPAVATTDPVEASCSTTPSPARPVISTRWRSHRRTAGRPRTHAPAWIVASSSGWPPSGPLSPLPPAPSRAGSPAPRR